MNNYTFSSKAFFLFVLFFLAVANSNKATPLFLEKLTLTFDNCNLPAPTNAVVTKVNSYSASVKWDNVVGAAGYYVRIFEIVNGVLNTTPVQEYEQQDTFRLFTNLASGRRYRIGITTLCPASQDLGSRGSDNTTIVYTILHDEVVFSQRPTNPFAGRINLTYEIATPGIVNMNILDMNGAPVIPVVQNEYKEQGTYQTTINTETVQPGLYFLNYQNGQNIKTLKLLKLN
jgi:Secretion system C-terminal sorting domain